MVHKTEKQEKEKIKYGIHKKEMIVKNADDKVKLNDETDEIEVLNLQGKDYKIGKNKQIAKIDTGFHGDIIYVKYAEISHPNYKYFVWTFSGDAGFEDARVVTDMAQAKKVAKEMKADVYKSLAEDSEEEEGW